MTKIHIEPLVCQPQLLASTAHMIYEEFWREVVDGMSVADLVAHLRTANSKTALPLSPIAHQNGQLLGTVNLIENDDEARRHLRPWLAAMVVRADRRGQGIGTELVKSLLNEARHLNIPTLYFGTDGPGFYERLGAVRHEQIRDDFCIMKFEL